MSSAWPLSSAEREPDLTLAPHTTLHDIPAEGNIITGTWRTFASGCWWLQLITVSTSDDSGS